MATYHGNPEKPHKKRKHAMGRETNYTLIGDKKLKKIRTRGGNEKLRLVATKYAQVFLEGKHVNCEILSVITNPANKDFTRRNVITKGAIMKVKTPEGNEINVRVTSRPGQSGVIDAVSA
jgi:small subunit ribosomal protein S8e